jgi:hypothetical protein
MKRIKRSLAHSRKRKVKLPNDFTDEERPRWYIKWKTLTVHPHLKIDYFKEIDTKEKAYWLGFLFADGCHTVSKRGTQSISIELNRKDEETIDHFCEALNLDKSRKFYRTRRGTEHVVISFSCKAMSFDLLRQGLIFNKSKIMRYPPLHDRELELTFLLGYYDGDGHRKTSRIISGSVRFLRDIKKRFGLPYKIVRIWQEREILGVPTRGVKYIMSLGADLLSEVMESFDGSMPRKRWMPCTKKEAARRTREALTPEKIQERRERQIQWRAITRSELQNLVWEMPITHIATRYHVHYKTVIYKCNRSHILRPPNEYWQKQRARKIEESSQQ